MWLFREIQTETGLHHLSVHRLALKRKMEVNHYVTSDNKHSDFGVSDEDGDKLIRELKAREEV